jgi:hypothetical protein
VKPLGVFAVIQTLMVIAFTSEMWVSVPSMNLRVTGLASPDSGLAIHSERAWGPQSICPSRLLCTLD